MNLQALRDQLKAGAVLYYNWDSQNDGLWYASNSIEQFRFFEAATGWWVRGE